MMYGQMTAGSWIYIGSQGIVQGTYETFVEAGRSITAAPQGPLDADRRPRRHGRRAAAGRRPWPAPPCLAIECQQSRIEMRLRTRYLDEIGPKRSTRRWPGSRRRTRGEEAGLDRLLGNAAEVCCPSSCGAASAPTSLTDQTSAHDPLNGYLPAGWTPGALGCRAPQRRIRKYQQAADRSGQGLDGRHVKAMLDIPEAPASRPSTTATTSARWRWRKASKNAFDFPGFVPAYIRPLFCRRPSARSAGRPVGRPRGHLQDRRQGQRADPRRPHLHNWLDMARERIAFQGLPARICWVGLGERHRLGSGLQRDGGQDGELKAPIVIGRDHLDSGSVASPNRETEAMKDGSDAVSDWPLLNALLNTASGATWVSLHHGGGVGMGFSQHAGMVIVCRRHRGRRPARRRACCGTTRPPASCAMPTRATRVPRPVPAATTSTCPR